MALLFVLQCFAAFCAFAGMLIFLSLLLGRTAAAARIGSCVMLAALAFGLAFFVHDEFEHFEVRPVSQYEVKLEENSANRTVVFLAESTGFSYPTYAKLRRQGTEWHLAAQRPEAYLNIVEKMVEAVSSIRFSGWTEYRFATSVLVEDNAVDITPDTVLVPVVKPELPGSELIVRFLALPLIDTTLNFFRR